MKRIRELGLDPNPIVSLMDRPISVFVDPKTRDILVDEGPGEGRMNGVVFFPSKGARFELIQDLANGEPHLAISCATTKFDLGDARQVGNAQQWVQTANSYLTNGIADQPSPVSAPSRESDARIARRPLSALSMVIPVAVHLVASVASLYIPAPSLAMIFFGTFLVLALLASMGLCRFDGQMESLRWVKRKEPSEEKDPTAVPRG